MSALHYTLTGAADRPAIVFLHGFMGSAEDWAPLADPLAEDGFCCLAVDAPGHGGSTGLPAEAYTMSGATRLLADLLDGLEMRRPALVGYSMGGRWALYAALRRPEQWRRLVLESASPGLASAEARAARRRVDAGRAAHLQRDLRGFLERWYRQPLFASLEQRAGLVEEMVRARARNDPHELGRSLRGMGTGAQPSLWEALRALRMPALALAGALDAKYVRLAHQMAARAAPMAVRVVPEAGHNTHAEAPAAFRHYLSDFLKRS